jgi:hypothetical protein
MVCHVKIYHLDQDRIKHGAKPVDPACFLRAVQADGWHIIALRRRNKFDHYVSGCLARARGGYHKTDYHEETIRLTIDRADLESGIRYRRARDQQEANALLGIPHIALEYESDLATPDQQQATIQRLLAVYGLEPRPASTGLKKIASRPASEIIANFDEAWSWALALDEE